ncbi:MAG: hypothetical protein ND895_00690 [Pyrinomonadaceae bacterium]|nr:hypothetical protein [Pyrinomonadaceae bacterium]
MKSSRNTARQLFGLTLTLVGLMCWNTLPIPLPERAVQAATRARVTEPTAPPVSRAVANGRVAFVSSSSLYFSSQAGDGCIARFDPIVYEFVPRGIVAD